MKGDNFSGFQAFASLGDSYNSYNDNNSRPTLMYRHTYYEGRPCNG